MTADTQEISKGLFPPQSWAPYLGGGILHAKRLQMYNTDFQGSVKLYLKRQFYLSGMNLTELSSVLLGKFGMQKKKTITDSKYVS